MDVARRCSCSCAVGTVPRESRRFREKVWIVGEQGPGSHQDKRGNRKSQRRRRSVRGKTSLPVFLTKFPEEKGDKNSQWGFSLVLHHTFHTDLCRNLKKR